MNIPELIEAHRKYRGDARMPEDTASVVSAVEVMRSAFESLDWLQKDLLWDVWKELYCSECGATQENHPCHCWNYE